MSYVPEPPPADPDIVLRRKTILRAVALRLDQGELVGEDDDRDVGAGTHARGLIDGQRVVYRLIVDDNGRTKVLRTQASAPAPSGFFLDVRRSAEVEQGHAHDMTFDDLPFDGAFIVDGAPERHLRELLDMHVRKNLVLAGDVSLSTDAGQFVITASEWTADSNRADAMLQVVARVASKARLIRDDRRQQHDAGSAGYRDPANASGNGKSDQAGTGDAHEIEMAVARRKKRHRGRQKSVLVIVGALIGAVVLFQVFFHLLN
jgi:hypothetical protein